MARSNPTTEGRKEPEPDRRSTYCDIPEHEEPSAATAPPMTDPEFTNLIDCPEAYFGPVALQKDIEFRLHNFGDIGTLSSGETTYDLDSITDAFGPKEGTQLFQLLLTGTALLEQRNDMAKLITRSLNLNLKAQQRVERLTEHIEIQEEQLTLLNTTMNEHEAREAALTEQNQALAAAARAASLTQNRPEPQNAKLPDPDLFTGDKDKYRDWKLRMQSKLELNADRFPSERGKVMYIYHRTGGTASQNLLPRVTEGSVNYLATAKVTWAFLDSIFDDPMRENKARTAFRNLTMKRTDKYQDFHTRFCQLAVDASLPEADYKQELYDKLSYHLQGQVTRDYLDPDVTFAKFQTLLSEIGSRHDDMKDRFPTNTKKTSDRGTGPREAASAPSSGSATAANSPTPDRPRPTYADREKQALSDKGLCFLCKKSGHFARNCPEKKTSVGNVETTVEAEKNSEN
jgi:hypothetical protein